MDTQKRNDWPSIPTQLVLRFQLVHRGLHAHMGTHTHKNAYTHAQLPSVTSVTIALGLQKCWVDRWCNNVILWIRVINVGHTGWYLSLLCKTQVKRVSVAVWVESHDINIYVHIYCIYMYVCVCLCESNLEQSKNEVVWNVICLWRRETTSIFLIEIFPSRLCTFPILLLQLSTSPFIKCNWGEVMAIYVCLCDWHWHICPQTNDIQFLTLTFIHTHH